MGPLVEPREGRETRRGLHFPAIPTISVQAEAESHHCSKLSFYLSFRCINLLKILLKIHSDCYGKSYRSSKVYRNALSACYNEIYSPHLTHPQGGAVS